MFEFLANIFGWLLNLIYNVVNNYGWALIIFTIIVKILLLPISIKQQKSMKKNAKLQGQMKALQFKYKNDPEKLNQEMMNLYKSEGTSPFAGCLSSIIQLILLLSVFYMVRQPLTYMKHVNEFYVNREESVENVQKLDISQNAGQHNETIPVLEYYQNKLRDEGKLGAYQEISVIQNYGQNDNKININMEFLGLDLSQIPKENASDFKVWVIPVLYIVSSFISMRLTTALQKSDKKKDKNEVIDITEDSKNGEDKENKEEKKEEDTVDMSAQTTKTMTWLMPIMTISIAFIAPLGLALYWLANNILMIIERLVLNKVLKSEEE